MRIHEKAEIDSLNVLIHTLNLKNKKIRFLIPKIDKTVFLHFESKNRCSEIQYL